MMEVNHYIARIAQNCVECGQCASSCIFLNQTGQSPLTIARREIAVSEAFSCALCGACEAVCPQGLSPKEMFGARRKAAITNEEIDINEYRYMFPDRKNNVMTAYRKHFDIDYSDIDQFDEADTCFFPGCTLMTYSPQLTRKVFEHLQTSCHCQGMWTACCGKSLDQMGLQNRLQQMHSNLKAFVQERNIKRIISACPGCHYELQEVFQASDVVIQTVYEVLDLGERVSTDRRLCTVHDSCPDRFAGIFSAQIRQALDQCGFSITEMIHNKAHTLCCGSGGQISHFRPDLVEKLVEMRQKEARLTDADIFVGYCLSCVLKYDGKMNGIPVTHALNLLLGVEEDFEGAKARATSMFSGSYGEAIWKEIMDD